MRSKLVLQQFADMSTLLPGDADKVKFINGHGGKAVAVFPAGTEFEGDMALFLCRTGQASPSDEECAKELGLSQAQIDSLQVEYRMDSLGINRKEDRELYRAGVIAGYDSDLNYLPGPNWEAYQEAIEAENSEGDMN